MFLFPVPTFFVIVSVLSIRLAGAEGFLGGKRHGRTVGEKDFQAAMQTVMGCGGDIAKEKMREVERSLSTMWRTLPQNSNGLVEWRMVRYIAHRYFMKKSSILVRGFEPVRHVNTTDLGMAEILGKRVPSMVEEDLHAKQAAIGYSLENTVAMIATLEHLISNDERLLLETVYKQQRKSPMQTLDEEEFNRLVESYIVHWLIDDDAAAGVLLAKPSMLFEAFPKWRDIKQFANGLVKTLQFSHRHHAMKGDGTVVFKGTYSFENAHEVVSGITNKFASFWESECQHIKESLVGLDKNGIGRVRLADFYGANADGEWRFGESEAYLRELGALDETSRWRGKQVIISNYLQGANNCIASTPHYLVCCINECEEVQNDVEDMAGAPEVAPEELLALVTSLTDIDDVPPKVDATLKTQLVRIAETHGGKVPLHGRLFAQWLHYVFPRECPFPHKAGTVIASTPTQYGDSSLASRAEVGEHAAARHDNASFAIEYEEAQLMAQWSDEEELAADYTRLTLTSTIFSPRTLLFVFVVSMSSVAVRQGAVRKGGAVMGLFEPKSHAHFV